jgi:hypothetical protein
MIEFAKESQRLLPKVVMTIVEMNAVDKEKSRRFVVEEVGAVFQVRPFF